MARLLEELLDVDAIIPEGRRRLLTGGLDAGPELLLVGCDASATTSTAAALTITADLVGDRDGLLDLLDGVVGAREDRGAGLAQFLQETLSPSRAMAWGSVR